MKQDIVVINKTNLQRLSREANDAKQKAIQKEVDNYWEFLLGALERAARKGETSFTVDNLTVPGYEEKHFNEIRARLTKLLLNSLPAMSSDYKDCVAFTVSW